MAQCQTFRLLIKTANQARMSIETGTYNDLLEATHGGWKDDS